MPKIEHPDEPIDRETFRQGQTLATACVHLSGGLRGVWQPEGWSVHPIPPANGPKLIGPLDQAGIERLAELTGTQLLGYEEISDVDKPLPSRVWTPRRRAPNGLSAADNWGSIAIAASRSGDDATASVARKIAVTLNAAGIRIRDASDCLNHQLIAAILEGRQPNRRFWNIPLYDLYLAFHSLLSEMASARDYIAQFAGQMLGAPEKVDALNRFDEWAGANSRSAIAGHPLAAALLGSRDDGPNAWLGRLTDYRNRFLHKNPLGASGRAASLNIVERTVHSIALQVIEMRIPTLDADESTSDALPLFAGLYERLIGLADFAAGHTDYSLSPPSFVVR